MSLIFSFDATKNRHYFYRGKDWNRNDYEENKILLADKEMKTYERKKVCHICRGEFCYDKHNESEFKQKKKSEIIVITQENLEELLIIFVFKIQSTKKYSSSIS